MSEKTDMGVSDTWSFWTSRQRLIILSIFSLTILIILNNQAILVPERADQAMWDYMAQAILRGQVPYRDVVNIKSPLSAYMSVLAILVGRAAGLNELIAIRCLGLVLAGALLSVMFAVAEAYTRSRLAALISVLVPLTWERFYSWASSGTEPKLSMILFGMISLLLMVKNKPFWAGAASMLSCLCWQPGLLFTGTAVLVFSKYFTSWRDRRVAKVMIGAAIPLLITLLYFYGAGALRDLWRWCFVFDLTVYAPQAYKGLGAQVSHISTVVSRTFGRTSIIFLPMAVAGYLMFFIHAVRNLSRTRPVRNVSSDRTIAGILIAPLVYLIYWRFDFNSGPYLIPIVPFVGIFLGWFVASWIELIRSRLKKRLLVMKPAVYSGLILVALFVYLAVATSVGTKYRGTTLEDEYALLEPLSTILSPEDKFWAQGEVNMLVLLNRPSVSKYIWFDRGKDEFAASDAPGGFQQVLDEIESQRPKFVEIGRIEGVRHRGEIEQWLEENYSPMPILGFEVYIRLPNAPDRQRTDNTTQ